jgi:hypothetical protein
LHAGCADLIALFLCNSERRRFLDNFLVATLGGAVAFAKVYCISVLIRDDLDFDVPRILEKFFQVDRVITKSAGCFLPGQPPPAEALIMTG